jgi:hypothetical protein
MITADDIDNYFFVLRLLGILTAIVLVYVWLLNLSGYSQRRIKKLHAFLDGFKNAPSNSFEIALVDAGLERLINGYRFKEKWKKFFKVFFRSPLILLSGGDEGEESGQVSVAQVPIRGIDFWMIFSSSSILNCWSKGQWAPGYLSGNGADVFQMVHERNEKSKRRRLGLVLNVGSASYTVSFARRDIKRICCEFMRENASGENHEAPNQSNFYALLAERSTGYEVAFKLGEKVRIGYPAEIPTQLIENLKNFFQSRAEVKFGYLGLLEQTENHPPFRYVIALDLDELDDLAVSDFYEEIGVIASTSGLSEERPVEFFLVESGNFISDHLTLFTPPFYVRENIKDFSWAKSKIKAVEIIPLLKKKKKLQIKISQAGGITANGEPITHQEARALLERLRDCSGEVWYYREQASQRASDDAMRVIRFVEEYGLPITFSSKEDFSDVVDGSGKIHVR